MVASALIGAGAGLVGDAVSGLFGNYSNKKSYEYASRLAEQQQGYAIEKMQNAYQWAVEDMKKAGLNPALMYNSAATPAMGTGSGGGTPSMTNPGAAFGNMGQQITSALELKQLESNINKTNAETDLMNAQSGKTTAETTYTLENTKLAQAQTLKTLKEAQLTQTQERNARAELQKMYAEMEEISEKINILRNQGKIAEVQAAFAKAEAIQRQITGYVESITGVIGAVKGTSALPTTSNHNSNNVMWQGK